MAEATRRITYQGPPHFVSLLVQMLEAQGVQVDHDAPMEYRDTLFARDVLVEVTATGAVATIALVVREFRERMRGRASARVEDDDADDDADDD